MPHFHLALQISSSLVHKQVAYMACWQLEGCFIMFRLCRYDKMSEGGTSGYGGAPGRAKGIKLMVGNSSLCVRMSSFPTKIHFFSYHNSQ